MRATRAIIHLENLRHNIRALKRELAPGVKICLAVKADAYGHGAARVSQAAIEEGIDVLGIATVEEGVELRKSGIESPVLLLSLPVPEELPAIVGNRITPIVASRELVLLFAREAERRNRKVEVHLKIDTGMGRVGCRPEEAEDLAGLIFSHSWLSLGGVCTHFPVSDIPGDPFTLRQIEIFRRCIESLKSRSIDPGIVHAANSGAVINYPDSHFNMVRPGILLYGYYPSKEQDRELELMPVMEFVTRIVFLKKVAKGTRLSYGLTYTTKGDSFIATLPVGYADGYSRLLSNRAEVAIQGRRYPVAGRICMDQCLVDLGSDTNVLLYDDAVLFGPGPGPPSAEDIADLMGTIPYEVTCLVGKRVPRVFVDP